MGQRLLSEDAHTLVGEEDLDGKPCYVVESVPITESIYGKKRQWIRKDDFTTIQIHYYDRKQDLLKTQKITWIRDGKMRVYKELDVRNVQTGHRTIYTITDLDLDSDSATVTTSSPRKPVASPSATAARWRPGSMSPPAPRSPCSTTRAAKSNR